MLYVEIIWDFPRIQARVDVLLSDTSDVQFWAHLRLSLLQNQSSDVQFWAHLRLSLLQNQVSGSIFCQFPLLDCIRIGHNQVHLQLKNSWPSLSVCLTSVCTVVNDAACIINYSTMNFTYSSKAVYSKVIYSIAGTSSTNLFQEKWFQSLHTHAHTDERASSEMIFNWNGTLVT